MPSTRATVIGLLLASTGAFAQTTGDPVMGKTLYENTPGVSGVGGITMSCPACHGDIQQHRALIAARGGLDGGAYADIDFDTAITRFTQAIQAQAGMAPFQALSSTQKGHLAAYLGDTPELTPKNDTAIIFSVAAVNNTSTAQTVSLKHALATTTNLQVISVQVVGSEAGNFSVTQQCVGTLAPGASCDAAVTYSPRNANVSLPDLVLTLRQGGSGDFERVLHLRGSIAGSNPSVSGGDSGGGALGFGCLVALAMAIVGVGVLRPRVVGCRRNVRKPTLRR